MEIKFLVQKTHLKMTSTKCWSFCSGFKLNWKQTLVQSIPLGTRSNGIFPARHSRNLESINSWCWAMSQKLSYHWIHIGNHFITKESSEPTDEQAHSTHWGWPNGCNFPYDISKYISLNENAWTSIKISLKFVTKGPINNIPALIQIMAWHQPGDKPLSEPMMVSLLKHICVTQSQWVEC